MTAQIITVSNQKGGTGKTAIAYELGTILAKKHKVLFIDLDAQKDLSRMLTDAEPRNGLLTALRGETSAESTIININDNVSVIPATDPLLSADTILTNLGGNISNRLRKALEPLKNSYDFIVIDTPPALGVLTVNALSAADIVYITALAENNSIDGLISFLKTLSNVNRARKRPPKLGGIIVTRYNGRSTINRKMLENIEKIADQIRTEAYPVKETVKLREAHFFRKSITEYAPKTDTAKQLNKIVLDLTERKGK